MMLLILLIAYLSIGLVKIFSEYEEYILLIMDMLEVDSNLQALKIGLFSIMFGIGSLIFWPVYSPNFKSILRD